MTAADVFRTDQTVAVQRLSEAVGRGHNLPPRPCTTVLRAQLLNVRPHFIINVAAQVTRSVLALFTSLHVWGYVFTQR
jgi:hypothetical protein